jgi:ABC-type bacteriocin/lantibiotic exporter with double-glycine peptidase domain
MVLGSYGLYVPEPYLREVCGCDQTGTSPQRLVQAAAEHFNLTGSEATNFRLADLNETLQEGLWPIVYLSLSELDLMNSHAVVVVEITEDDVLVLDPELDDPGEAVFEIAEFEARWYRAQGRTILVA